MNRRKTNRRKTRPYCISVDSSSITERNVKIFKVKERTQPIKEKNREGSKQNKKTTIRIKKMEQHIDRMGEHR